MAVPKRRLSKCRRDRRRANWKLEASWLRSVSSMPRTYDASSCLSYMWSL